MTREKQKNIRYMFVDIFLNFLTEDFNFSQFAFTHPTFDSDFNEPFKIGMLPETLTYLYLGNRFNKSVEIGMLPSKLTHIEFGNHYNQLLEQNVLPPKLIHLKFGHFYNKPFKNGVFPYR